MAHARRQAKTKTDHLGSDFSGGTLTITPDSATLAGSLLILSVTGRNCRWNTPAGWTAVTPLSTSSPTRVFFRPQAPASGSVSITISNLVTNNRGVIGCLTEYTGFTDAVLDSWAVHTSGSNSIDATEVGRPAARTDAVWHTVLLLATDSSDPSTTLFTYHVDEVVTPVSFSTSASDFQRLEAYDKVDPNDRGPHNASRGEGSGGAGITYTGCTLVFKESSDVTPAYPTSLGDVSGVQRKFLAVGGAGSTDWDLTLGVGAFSTAGATLALVVQASQTPDTPSGWVLLSSFGGVWLFIRQQAPAVHDLHVTFSVAATGQAQWVELTGPPLTHWSPPSEVRWLQQIVGTGSDSVEGEAFRTDTFHWTVPFDVKLKPGVWIGFCLLSSNTTGITKIGGDAFVNIGQQRIPFVFLSTSSEDYPFVAYYGSAGIGFAASGYISAVFGIPFPFLQPQQLELALEKIDARELPYQLHTRMI